MLWTLCSHQCMNECLFVVLLLFYLFRLIIIFRSPITSKPRRVGLTSAPSSKTDKKEKEKKWKTKGKHSAEKLPKSSLMIIIIIIIKSRKERVGKSKGNGDIRIENE